MLLALVIVLSRLSHCEKPPNQRFSSSYGWWKSRLREVGDESGALQSYVNIKLYSNLEGCLPINYGVPIAWHVCEVGSHTVLNAISLHEAERHNGHTKQGRCLPELCRIDSRNVKHTPFQKLVEGPGDKPAKLSDRRLRPVMQLCRMALVHS